MLWHHYALPGALLLVMALCVGLAVVLTAREVAKRQIVKHKSRDATRHFRPDALTRIDFVIIGAIALTFVAIASTTI